MLNVLQSSSIVVGSIILALLLQWQLRRVWPPQNRKPHNDLIGWQIGFLATTYAVIVAFMLSGVWHDYQEAEANAEVEANSLILLHRMSDGVPTASCAQLKGLTRRYADSMIKDEWPALNKGLSVNTGTQLIHSMWKTAIHIQPQTSGEQIVLNRILAELSNLAEHYRIRHYQSHAQLPAVFWLVLILGGAVIVAYTCLLGVESDRMHSVQVVTTTLVVSLILVTIADVDQPFRGAIHIPSEAFRLALKTFDTMP
jgi:hypothetical protein